MGTKPPIQIPFFLEAAILSRMRSPVTSRSNWAKERRTLRVSLPIEVVVLKAWVTEPPTRPARVAPVVVGGLDQLPAFTRLALHIGLAGLPLGLEGVEVLIQ